jgi:hypothetical protein
VHRVPGQGVNAPGRLGQRHAPGPPACSHHMQCMSCMPGFLTPGPCCLPNELGTTHESFMHEKQHGEPRLQQALASIPDSVAWAAWCTRGWNTQQLKKAHRPAGPQ